MSDAFHWNTAVTHTIFNSIGNTETSRVYSGAFILNLMEDLLSRGSMKFSQSCLLTFYVQDLEFCQCDLNVHFHY